MSMTGGAVERLKCPTCGCVMHGKYHYGSMETCRRIARLEADFAAFRATAAELDADRIRKIEEVAALKAELQEQRDLANMAEFYMRQAEDREAALHRALDSRVAPEQEEEPICTCGHGLHSHVSECDLCGGCTAFVVQQEREPDCGRCGKPSAGKPLCQSCELDPSCE